MEGEHLPTGVGCEGPRGELVLRWIFASVLIGQRINGEMALRGQIYLMTDHKVVDKF